MIHSIRCALKSRNITSMETPIKRGDEGAATLKQIIPDDKRGIDFKLDDQTLVKSMTKALGNLDERKRNILLLRFNVITEDDISPKDDWVSKDDRTQDLVKRFQNILKRAKMLDAPKKDAQPKKEEPNLQIFIDFDDYVEQNKTLITQAQETVKKLELNGYPDLWSDQSKTHDDDISSKNGSLKVTRSARLYSNLLFHDYQRRQEQKKKKEDLN